MSEPARSVREIFAEALEISNAEQRTAFLNRMCGTDAALRCEVEELLQAEADAGSFLPDQPATSQSALHELVEAAQSIPAPCAPLSEKPGDHIGRYELVEKIGEGGCGAVYRAQQQAPVRRQVALKVIKLGMDTRQVIARFEAERQALALMDHPKIAKVFDAGATDTGRPYFVMELVRGVKITDYCNEHALSTRARLELFIQVCHAVEHAHQKGIIHRDLKPSNILVTVADRVAAPKVIDFGIAKATEGKLADQTLFTAFEQFIGTPAYMSPEQAAMTGDIDTRSDIYSLGVLLYELLAGTTPFDTKELLAVGVDELRRTIREKEPKRPSTRLTQEVATRGVRSRKRASTQNAISEQESGASSHRLLKKKELIHQLRGDLDWIVMKCLEKDRTRRYETASGLANDLKRHLNNEPVMARPPSRLYEFQKTVRRHKVGFASAAAVIMALLVGASFAAIGFVQARRQRDMANIRAYTSDMNVAKQAWDEGNLVRAQDLLAAHIPNPGEPDRRGFEWRLLWNLCRDESLKTVSFTNAPVQILASSPAHSFVAAACQDSVRLLDPATGDEVHRFSYPNSETANASYAIALASGATNLLAAHRAEGVVALWDVANQTLLMTFRTLTNGLATLALSPDGRFVAAGTAGHINPALSLWDISSRPQPPQQPVWTRPLTNGLGALAFSVDGQTLVGGESFLGNGLLAWNATTGRETGSFPMLSSANISSVAVSPDGSLVACGGVEARIHVFDFANRAEKFTLDGHLGYVAALAFSTDGKRLISSGGDGTVRLWDLPAERRIGMWRDPHSLNVRSVIFTPQGNGFFSANSDEIRMWSADPPSSEPLIEAETLAGMSAISPDGRWLVVTDGIKHDSDLNGAQIWELASRTRKLRLVSNLKEPFAPAFTPDGRLLALGDLDKGGVSIWETQGWGHPEPNSRPVHNLATDFEVGSLAFSPDGRILAAAGLCFFPRHPSQATNRLAFWEVGSWRKLDLLPGAGAGLTEQEAAAGIAFSHNGRWLAIGYRDGRVRLWDFKRQRLIKELTRHKDNWKGVTVAFSRDDRWLISLAKGSGTVNVFDLTEPERPRHVKTIRPSSGGTWFATFAPDQKSLVTASGDGLIKFWNLQTLSVALALAHGHGPSNALAFTPKGELLVAQDAQGRLKLWTAPLLGEIDGERKGK